MSGELLLGQRQEVAPVLRPDQVLMVLGRGWMQEKVSGSESAPGLEAHPG